MQEGNICCDDLDRDYEPSDDNSSTNSEEDDDDHEDNEKELEKNIGENNETGEIAQKQIFRKKARNPNHWKRNVKKLKVNSGLPYITEGNKEKSGRSLKPPCDDNCRTKCNKKFSHEDRKEIHSRYWNLKNNTLQRQFVASHLEKLCPKYRRTVEGSNRSVNLSYLLTLNGIKVKVCKKFFMSTLDIGDKFIRTTWKKSDGKGVVERDRRGNFMKRETVPAVVKDKIREHINSFPRIESHYLRAQTTKEYIDGSLTLAQMYRYYKLQEESEGRPVAKKCTYEHIFNHEFNITFFQPKKDQCAICEAYKNSSPEEQAVFDSSYKKHIYNKDRSREEKSQDIARAKDDPQITVACFDLQAVLPTPCGDVSTFYYKCRLNCFNFTIFEIASKKGHCYFWHEAIANRGANEIATCLLDYLSSFCVNKDVIFYSDNCVGQNKNKFIVTMYLYAIAKIDIKSITHKFLTVGHTQNEGDAMHSTIERQKKKVLRTGPIYVPAQWPVIIRCAKKEGHPYNVREMSTEEFYDFKDLNLKMGKNFTKNKRDKKVVWNDIQAIKVDKNYPGSFFYKTEFDDDFEEVSIKGTTRRSASLEMNLDLKKAYTKPPAISHKTKQHLLELCNKNLIKPIHHKFFKDLVNEK